MWRPAITRVYREKYLLKFKIDIDIKKLYKVKKNNNSKKL